MKLSARRSPPKLVVNKSGLSSNLSAHSEYLSVYQTSLHLPDGAAGYGRCPTGQLPGTFHLPDMKLSCHGQSVNR